MKRFCLVVWVLGFSLTYCATHSLSFELIFAQVNLSERSFEQTVFGKMLADGARRKCSETLEAHVELIEKAIPLRDDERAKLLQAGEFDIHRFFDKFKAVKRGLTFGSVSRNELNAAMTKLQMDAQPLKAEFVSGLHGEGSLFSKVTESSFDQQTIAKVRGIFAERRMVQFEAQIKLVLSTIDRRVPMTIEKRKQVTDLLLTKTKPPLVSDGTNPIYAILGNLSEIEEELGPLFSEEEWLVLEPMLELGRRRR